MYEFTGSNLIILDEEEIEKEKYFQMYDSQESIIVVDWKILL